MASKSTAVLQWVAQWDKWSPLNEAKLEPLPTRVCLDLWSRRLPGSEEVTGRFFFDECPDLLGRIVNDIERGAANDTGAPGPAITPGSNVRGLPPI